MTSGASLIWPSKHSACARLLIRAGSPGEVIKAFLEISIATLYFSKQT